VARRWTEEGRLARQLNQARPPIQTDWMEQKGVGQTRLGAEGELAARLLKRNREWQGETCQTARIPSGPE
jgi:hypothetical protein